MYIHFSKVHRPKKRKWCWVSPFSWVSIIQSLKQNPPKSASKRSRTPCFWTLTSQHGVLGYTTKWQSLCWSTGVDKMRVENSLTGCAETYQKYLVGLDTRENLQSWILPHMVKWGTLIIPYHPLQVSTSCCHEPGRRALNWMVQIVALWLQSMVSFRDTGLWWSGW